MKAERQLAGLWFMYNSLCTRTQCAVCINHINWKHLEFYATCNASSEGNGNKAKDQRRDG